MIKKAAADLKKVLHRNYKTRQEYRAVKAQKFGHLDLEYYDHVRDELVSRGCVCVGDYENVTLKGSPNDPMTFLRILISSDGHTSIALYHYPLLGPAGRIIDCETELGSNGYLVTSNAQTAGQLDPPPGFDMKYYSPKTPATKVFEAHHSRIKKLLAKSMSMEATLMKGVGDVLEMQERMHAAKAAYRQQVGYVTEKELERLGADASMAKALKRMISNENG